MNYSTQMVIYHFVVAIIYSSINFAPVYPIIFFDKAFFTNIYLSIARR